MPFDGRRWNRRGTPADDGFEKSVGTNCNLAGAARDESA